MRIKVQYQHSLLCLQCTFLLGFSPFETKINGPNYIVQAIHHILYINKLGFSPHYLDEVD